MIYDNEDIKPIAEYKTNPDKTAEIVRKYLNERNPYLIGSKN